MTAEGETMRKARLTLVVDLDSQYEAAYLVACIGRAPHGVGLAPSVLTDEQLGAVVRGCHLVACDIDANGGEEMQRGDA